VNAVTSWTLSYGIGAWYRSQELATISATSSYTHDELERTMTMPLIADSAKGRAAASLIRAGICDDAGAGVLILQQQGGTRDELRELTLAVTALAVRVLLSANGFNVAKTMKVIDQWIEQYGREAAASGESAST
jgi:hypothetical protein